MREWGIEINCGVHGDREGHRGKVREWERRAGHRVVYGNIVWGLGREWGL